MTDEEKEEVLKPFGWCGCSDEQAMLDSIKKVLLWASEGPEWKKQYDEIFTDLGSFYIIAGILSDHDYIEHGTAIRYSWLLSKGRELLNKL